MKTQNIKKSSIQKEPPLVKPISKTPLIVLFNFWLLNHVRAALFGLGELIRSPIASTMTVIVIGIAMAFPAGLFILLRNFSSIGQQWNSEPTISLYLERTISHEQLNSLLLTLQRRPQIEKINYISPAQGLKQFISKTQLGDALTVLPINPLPGLVVITPKVEFQSQEKLKILLNQVKTMSGVNEAHLDLAWIERLHNLMTLAQRIIYSLGLFLSIGVILIVGNTIRLATQNRCQEILVMQLIGATNAYIRRPFLYRGFFYGLLGGVVAWFLVLTLILGLRGPALPLTPFYARQLWGWQHTMNIAIIVILGSGFLSLLGSWSVVSRYLRKGTQQELSASI